MQIRVWSLRIVVAETFDSAKDLTEAQRIQTRRCGCQGTTCFFIAKYNNRTYKLVYILLKLLQFDIDQFADSPGHADLESLLSDSWVLFTQNLQKLETADEETKHQQPDLKRHQVLVPL